MQQPSNELQEMYKFIFPYCAYTPKLKPQNPNPYKS